MDLSMDDASFVELLGSDSWGSQWELKILRRRLYPLVTLILIFQRDGAMWRVYLAIG